MLLPLLRQNHYLMQNEPKKHHFVPVCYLKAFTNTEKSFYKKRLDYGKITPATPAQVCYEVDGNRFNIENNIYFNNVEDEYHIEKHAFSSQENNYRKIILTIMGHQTGPQVLDASEYHLFIKTLITIKRRNPSWREGLIKTFREGYVTEETFIKVKEFLTKMSKQIGEKMPSDETIREHLTAKARSDGDLRDMYLSGYLNKNIDITISEISDELLQLTQYILQAPTGLQFITSDNPGFLFYDNRIVNGTGFGGAYELYFPLSPMKCLYVNTADTDNSATSVKKLHHIETDAEKVSFINIATKSLASKIILALYKHVLVDI